MQENELVKKILEGIDKRFEKQNKRIDTMFEEQSKEIAQEFRTVVDYICKRDDKKIEKVERQLKKEIKTNKVAHDSYNAKIYSIELSQSNLEAKMFDAEESNKLDVS